MIYAEVIDDHIKSVVSSFDHPDMVTSINQTMGDFPFESFEDFKNSNDWRFGWGKLDKVLLFILIEKSPLDKFLVHMNTYIFTLGAPVLLLLGSYWSENWWLLFLAPFWLISTLFGIHQIHESRFAKFCFLLSLLGAFYAAYVQMPSLFIGFLFFFVCIASNIFGTWNYQRIIWYTAISVESALMISLSRGAVILLDEHFHQIWVAPRFKRRVR